MPEPVNEKWKKANLWIQTVSGKKYDYTKPHENLSITDIAHALSQMCRFGGHVDYFYSVAHHSVLVSRILEEGHPELQLYGLLHDAHEAYLCDIPSPAKWEVNENDDTGRRTYQALAYDIQYAISMKYCERDCSLKEAGWKAINRADSTALILERERLFDAWIEGSRCFQEEEAKDIEYRKAMGVTGVGVTGNESHLESMLDALKGPGVNPFKHGKQLFLDRFLELV